MDFKKCCICKKEFPKTLEFFHGRKIKQKNVKGEIKIYESFKYACKHCLNNKAAKKQRDKYNENKDFREKELYRCKTWVENNKEKRRIIARNTYLKNITKNKEYDKKRTQDLTDSKIANMIGIHLKELPKEVIQTKRLIIQLKRELKSN